MITPQTSRLIPDSLLLVRTYAMVPLQFTPGTKDQSRSCATNMQIDHLRGLSFVWMVQHNGFPGSGSKSQDTFKQTAIAAFAP